LAGKSAVIRLATNGKMLNKIALRRLGYWVNEPGPQDIFQAKVLEFELGQLGFKISNLAILMNSPPPRGKNLLRH
jgi:hypothetical protein